MADVAKLPVRRTKLSAFIQNVLVDNRLRQTDLLKRMGRDDKRAVLSNIIRGVTGVPRREILEPLARVLTEGGYASVTVEDLRQMATELLPESDPQASSVVRATVRAQTGADAPAVTPDKTLATRVARGGSLEPSSSKYTLAIGHCLWAAPIALAFEGKQADEEFKVICCDWEKFFDEDDYRERSGDWPDIQPGPETPGADSPSEGQAGGDVSARLENKKRVGSLSAAQVMELLLERRLVEVAAVPLDIAEKKGPRVKVVGTLVDCEIGCTLVYPAKGKLDHALHEFKSGKKYPASSHKDDGQEEGIASEVTTNELGLALSQLAENESITPQIGAEDETVAYIFLDDAITRGWPTRGPAPSASDFQWHYNNRDLAWTSFRELQAKCKASGDGELVGIITWEPHGTWAVLQSRDVKLRKAPLVYARGHRGSKRHLRFGIVIRTEDALKKDFCDALTRLMRKLEPSAQCLNDIINDGSGQIGDLSRIARFYGLAPSRKPLKNLSLDQRKEVRELLASCHYSVRNLVSSSKIAFDA